MNLILKAECGRDAFVNAENFTFGTDSTSRAIIYGNLEYSSNNELELSKELVQGNVNYTKSNIISSNIILGKLIEFLSVLLFTVIVYLLLNWLAKKFVETSKNYIGKKSFKTFGIGLISYIVALLVGFLLLFTIIGVPLGFVILAAFLIIMSISFTVVTICITYKIKEKFKFEKKYLTFIVLAIITTILWALQQIPYANAIFSLLITLFGFGIMVDYLFTANRKEHAKEVKEN